MTPALSPMVLVDVPTSSRKHRRPRYKFLVDQFPYLLFPVALGPVWPGESMVNLWFESRVVSEPLASSISGWGVEYYLFYVKMSDLVDHPEVMDMLIDPTNAALTGSGTYYDADAQFNHQAGFPNYGKMCYDRIVKTYFRDDGEDLATPAGAKVGSLYMVKFKDHALFDSITSSTFDDAIATPPVADGMDDLARAQDLYDYLVAANLTDMSYQDWCAAYGVKTPATELNEPELLLKWSDWGYPSNTINPVDGSPSSAFSTVIKKSFNEPRFFKEPGFLQLLSVYRPKLFIENQKSNSTDYLNTALSWLPAMLSADPTTSVREFQNNVIMTAPSVGTDKSIVDMRDVPLYGDQYIYTIDAAAGDNPVVASFQEGAAMRYPAYAELGKLFTDETGDFWTVHADGFVNFDIVGRIQDYTTARSSG